MPPALQRVGPPLQPLLLPPSISNKHQPSKKGSTGEEEDDGYVIVAVHNAETGKGEVAILDARSLSSGPVATIKLPHALPAGLHGSFADGVVTHEAGGAEPKWREPNVVRQI